MISGERPAPEQIEEDKGFRRRFERRFGKFTRTFSVRRVMQRTSHTRVRTEYSPVSGCCPERAWCSRAGLSQVDYYSLVCPLLRSAPSAARRESCGGAAKTLPSCCAMCVATH